jgi:hypothetical protein
LKDFSKLSLQPWPFSRYFGFHFVIRFVPVRQAAKDNEERSPDQVVRSSKKPYNQTSTFAPE